MNIKFINPLQRLVTYVIKRISEQYDVEQNLGYLKGYVSDITFNKEFIQVRLTLEFILMLK